MKKSPTWLLPIILLALCLGQPGTAHAEDPSDPPDPPQLIQCTPNDTPVTLLDDDAAFPTRLAAYDSIYGLTLLMTDPAYNAVYFVLPTEKPILVELLAGAPGPPGFQDGNGTDARFNSPRGVAVDEQGNTYVADYNNLAIRKITPNRDVITIAGNRAKGNADAAVGVNATFKGPHGVAYGRWRGVPTLFVTDDRNNLIRAIDLSNPNYPVTTLRLNVWLDFPRSIDWWAESDPVFDEQGIFVGWRVRDRGYIFVTDSNGIYQLAENEDGSFTVSQIARGAKAHSVYADDRLNLWIVPEGRNTIEKIERGRDRYAETPTPQRLCLGDVQNPQTAMPLYGGIVFIDQAPGNNRAQLVIGGIGNSPTNIRSAPSTIGPR